MLDALKSLLSSAPQLTWSAVLDIALVAYLAYQFLMIVRGRRAAHILLGVLILTVIYGIAATLDLQMMSALLSGLAPYAPFALIVMFQSEIRRVLARIGRRRWVTFGGKLQKREFAEEIVLAMTQLSEQRTGALIVIERDIGLRTFIETGVMLDACVSRDLLLTIFLRGSLLHDGAVIIQSDRLAAAACFLPLTVKPAVARSLGTRHRAAIGVTEETDCLALVVSEETGRLSVASFGDIDLDVSPENLQRRITDHLIHKRSAFGRDHWPERDEERFDREAARDAHAD